MQPDSEKGVFRILCSKTICFFSSTRTILLFSLIGIAALATRSCILAFIFLLVYIVPLGMITLQVMVYQMQSYLNERPHEFRRESIRRLATAGLFLVGVAAIGWVSLGW